jgi:manganese/iron transport system ATP-binding protein
MSEILLRPLIHDLTSPPLQVSDVSVHFNGTAVLRHVSFTLLVGQRAAVVGPNGSGKTTLLKVIAGALDPTAGAVSIYGHRPGGHVCIAYVPQRSQVDWNFPVTVSQVVMMGRIRKLGLFHWPRRADWRLVQECLEQVGMGDQEKAQIGELSGGQQQRVFLAQALAQEAELILLDEPLTGLDLPSQEAIFGLLDGLREQGVPVMVSTHDLNLAAERFDQVILLNRRLIAYGPPQDVFSRDNLTATYGGHIHTLSEADGMLVLTDTCCEGDEEEEG